MLKRFWPRGRYNRRRITGLSINLRLDVAHWWWFPRAEWHFGSPRLQWLCLSLNAEPSYHWED